MVGFKLATKIILTTNETDDNVKTMLKRTVDECRASAGERRGRRGRAGRGGKVIDDDVRPDNRFVLCRSVLISNIQTGRDTFFLFRFTLSGAISRALLHGSRHASPRAPRRDFFSLYCFTFCCRYTRCGGDSRSTYPAAPQRTGPHRVAPQRSKCDCF